MPSRPGSPFSRPRWTLEDAREVIAAFERSGKPVALFAADHGLDPQRIYAWRRRLGEAELTTFQEIVVRPVPAHADAAAHRSSFEIALASGEIVRVPPSFDGPDLARLLDVLARSRSC